MASERRRPQIYVLYTMSGQEEKIIRLLYHTVLKKSPAGFSKTGRIRSDEEYLFSPVAGYHIRVKQQDRLIEKYLYPGYIFLNTAAPVDFYKRLIDTKFFARFGKYFKVLHEMPIPEKKISGAQSAEEDTAARPSTDEWETQYGDYFRGISEQEERVVLNLCGLEREKDGDIVRQRQKQINPEDLGKLQEADINIGRFAKESENGKKTVISDQVAMSYGIKVTKKGSHPGHRGPEDVRTIVFDGPLMGMEGELVKIDPHRQIGVIRTTFMQQTMDVKVPLTILKTIEE